MNKGNQGFGASLAGSVNQTTPAARSTPAQDVLDSRSDALAQLASGKLVTDRTEWVDPARCRPWRLHNRALDHLDEHSCADLITSLKAEGRQRIPAIVRRLKGDPDHDFEIIAGVRRWWTISWLRAHNYPDFHYLVTIQNVTDEEGFRLADVENRARRDISDLERARDYLRALDLFYGGSQSDMATRLNVSNSWMSRILEVGRLPQPVLDAFPDSHMVTARYAGQIAPLLRRAETRDRVIETATEIAERGGAEREAHLIVAELLKAATTPKKARSADSYAISSAAGKPMLKVDAKGKGKGMTIRILPRNGADRAEIQAAVLKVIDQHS